MKSKIIDNRYFLKNTCNDMRTQKFLFRDFVEENLLMRIFFDESFYYLMAKASKLAVLFLLFTLLNSS